MRALDDYEHQFLEILAKGLAARARSKVEGRTIVYGKENVSDDNENDDYQESEVSI